MFNRYFDNVDEELDRLSKVSRPSVICSNPIAKQKTSDCQFDVDKSIFCNISKVLTNEKAKKALKRKTNNSIPKKLQVLLIILYVDFIQYFSPLPRIVYLLLTI